MFSNDTIDQVKSSAKIADVISDFLEIKKQGTNFNCCCPFHEEKTPSFVINPTDNFYKCFGCGKAGDSIKFLEEYKKWTFQESILYLANKYKIQVEEEGAKKTYLKPVWTNKTDLSDKLVQWFEKERKISQKTLKLMRITESDEYMYEHKVKFKDGSVKTYPAGIRKAINFNYFRNDELINVKYRDSIKSFKLFKDGELIFYNLDSLIDAKGVYFVEGENDVLALVECGLLKAGTGVVSVPNGANIKSNNLTYLDSAIPLLDKVYENYIKGLEKNAVEKPIFHLGFDNDAAGRKLREDVAERLGKDKCDYIEWRDKKDGNDVLIADGIQAVLDCVKHPKEFPINGAFKASVFKDAVDDMYVNGVNRGVGIGIEGFDKLLRFVTGYITLITGYPNSGKSDWVDEMMLRLMLFHGWKGGVYSPENYPTQIHLSKLIRKLIGKNWYGRDKINELEKNLGMRFLEDKIWFIIPEKDFTINSILDTVLNLKKRYGINFFLLDAWNRIEHKYTGGNDVKYITDTLNRIDNFCKEHNLHCFLVAHPTQPQIDKKTGKLPVATMSNISGGAQFNNIIANGMSVYRDYGTFNPILKKYDNQVSTVYVQKVKMQPYWGHQGYCEFKYDIPSGRYNEMSGDNSILDVSNWITKENRSITLNLEDEYNNQSGIIIGNPNEEPPF